MNHLKSIIIGICLLISGATTAQVSLNINIGSAPDWGPAGYTEVRYYYLPDVEAYYDIQSSMFIYYGDGIWVHEAYLPSRYRNYDLYGAYKVVMTDYRGDSPYVHFKEYKVKYKKGYRGPAQKTIGANPKGGGQKFNSKNSSGGEMNKQQNNSGNKNEQRKSNNGPQKNNGAQQSHGGGKGKK